ncbi:DUF4147 domain-containing protein [Candidatus Kaiserbacteria bacterium]|nr:DUF4147 domain-containing protein [Candidatus Kaiserbacteria bacterium]
MRRTIQNFDALATSALRLDALEIAEAGYAAIDIGNALPRALCVEDGALRLGGRTFPLVGRRVFFVGVGKCAFAAAKAVKAILGNALESGIAFDVSSADIPELAKIEAYIGTHPLPSEANERATRRVIEFLSGRTKDDLVIVLISGGGSALLCLPPATMTCVDDGALWSALTARGASIQDINTVRKHTSRARGGGLAAAAYPAEIVSCIISDVPGDDIGYIASGPTALDTSTIADARAILARYGVASASNVECIETPKDPKYFERVTNILLLSSRDALAAMKEEAERRGYAAVVENDRVTGEARDIGRAIATKIHDSPAKTALLYAGESTVTISASAGNGGRNQELALAALPELHTDELVLSFASDGHDNTDHAGAIADVNSFAHAQEKNLSPTEFLDEHRSYDFFLKTGDALLTGYTGSNVSDLIIAMKQ